MKVEIDERLLSLLKRRKEILEEDDLETKSRSRECSWSDEYDDLCASIARSLSIIVFERGEV